MIEKLFTINNKGDFVFSEYALGIDAFYKLWLSDKSVEKKKAVKDLSFCYFMTSMSTDNIYREYQKEERFEVVVKDVYGDMEFTMTDEIQAAFEKILDTGKSVAKEFLRAAINSSYKLKIFLEQVNLDERDSNGRLIHNSKQFKDSLESMVTTLKKIEELKKMVKNEEMENKAKIRGDGKQEFDI